MIWSRKRIFRAIVSLRTTPRAIALGAAVGVFCAFSPLLGLQMIIAAFLATVIGGNRPVAIAATWIANPLTVVPVIVMIHKVGRWILGASTMPNTVGRWLSLLEEHSFSAYKGFLQNTVAASGPAAAALFTGWVVCGLLSAAVVYPLVLVSGRWIAERRRLGRQSRRLRRG